MFPPLQELLLPKFGVSIESKDGKFHVETVEGQGTLTKAPDACRDNCKSTNS